MIYVSRTKWAVHSMLGQTIQEYISIKAGSHQVYLPYSNEIFLFLINIHKKLNHLHLVKAYATGGSKVHFFLMNWDTSSCLRPFF